MQQHAHNDNLIGKNSETLSQLRQLVAGLEGCYTPASLPERSAKTGQQRKAEVQAFTGDINGGQVHEIWAEEPEDTTPSMAFILNALTETDEPFLWVTSRYQAHEHGLPYGPGLAIMNIDPARLLLVRCRDEKEALWAIEEGLKCPGLAAVIGELEHMDLTASRRLVLATRHQSQRCLLLLRTGTEPASAAHSRYRVKPAQSQPSAANTKAPGPAKAEIKLTKHRAGKRPSTQTMEWHHAQDHLSLLAPVANRTPSPRTATAKQALG